MPDIRYLSIEQAIQTHRKTVDVSGGGVYGVLNAGQLESVLVHIQNDSYYPSFVDKLTHLFFSVCKFHCFQDGNKRLAITLSAQFLLINGYLHFLQQFMPDMENISYHVAAGNIDKDLLHEILDAYLNGVYDDEALKLKIFTAISQGEDPSHE